MYKKEGFYFDFSLLFCAINRITHLKHMMY